MARIKLTKPWKAISRKPYYDKPIYRAEWYSIRLSVDYTYHDGKYAAQVRMGVSSVHTTARCRTLRIAKREAERMAMEIAEDIARTVGPQLAQFGLEVEDA